MARLTLRNGADSSEHHLTDDRYVLGKDAARVHIRLEDAAVSRQHAEVVKTATGWLLRDLQSSNGTFVNDRPVTEKVLGSGDVIGIRPFVLVFNDEQAVPAKPSGNAAAPEMTGATALRDDLFEVKKQIHREFISRMDLKKLDIDRTEGTELETRVKSVLDSVIGEQAHRLGSDADIERFRKEMIDDVLGLGPIQDLVDDENVTEIMVNHRDQIYFEKEGKLYRSPARFYDDGQLLRVIERILSETGKSINESSPLVDTRLVSDGSRVNAVIPPLAVKGPCLTIRKFSRTMLGPEALVGFGSISPGMVEFLKICVKQRKNIVVSGGTGSGKTTLLNILSSFIPADERIVTVEDAAELQLQQDHVITLEARSANLEGKGAIPIRDLVKNCLRMRPDRIIVGECRGGEALDMLQAMNTGHDGSLTTVHANSPRDALTRMETMVLMTGMDLPMKAIRSQIESAIDIIIQQSRFADGSRKVTHITEITGMENDVITSQDIFTYNQRGFDKEGKVVGEFTPTTVVPAFYDELRDRGIEVDYSIFQS